MRRPLQIGNSLSTFEFGKRVPGGSRYARVDEVPLLRPLDSSYCRIPLAFHIARKPISFDGGSYHEAARPAHAEAAEAAVRDALRRGRFINCGNRNHLAEIRVVKLSTAIFLRDFVRAGVAGNRQAGCPFDLHSGQALLARTGWKPIFHSDSALRRPHPSIPIVAARSAHCRFSRRSRGRRAD